MADGRDELVVLGGVDVDGDGASGLDEAEDDAHGGLAGDRGGRERPGGALEEVDAGGGGAAAFGAGHGMAADDAHLVAEDLFGLRHEGRLGAAGIGDDGARCDVGLERGQELLRGAGGHREHDHARVANSLVEVADGAVDGLHLARGARVLAATIDADDLVLAVLAGHQVEAHGRADEAGANDGDLRFLRVGHVCSRAIR